MENKNESVSVNYEALYEKTMDELSKATEKLEYVCKELERKQREIMWYEGIKQTIEVIFGRGFGNGQT